MGMPNRKFIPEVLEEINKDTTLLASYKDSAALRMVFEYAFLVEKKFDLPEGEPPFKHDAAPIGMSPGNLTMELRRLYIFTKERDLATVRRETLFIQMLEGLHPSEAKLLVAVKDQNLSSLYPNITADLLIDNGFLSEEAEIAEPTKRGRGRPRKNS